MDVTQEEDTEQKFKELLLKDNLINKMYMRGASEKQMVIALASVVENLSKINLALSQITPRKMKGPDGSVVIWRCPDALVPDSLDEITKKEDS